MTAGTTVSVSTWGIVEQAREETPELEDQHLEIPNYELSTSWKVALRRTSKCGIDRRLTTFSRSKYTGG